MPTVYDMPEGANTDYAVRQEMFDRQVAEEMYTPDGRIEATASQAAAVRSTVRQLPAWTVLFGLELKTTIAQFPEPADELVYRSFSTFEAPTLGSAEKRTADAEKVMNKLESLPDKGGVEDNLAGMRIAEMINLTRENNKMIAETQSQMGSVIGV